MGESAKMTSGDRLVVTVGVVLLAVGLVALFFPVFLNDYDEFGIQIKCGTGYFSQFLQDNVDQCKSAVAFRRAWAIPIAGLGALILIPKMVMWVYRRATELNSAASAGPWSERPDTYLHEAAVLDRRESAHRERPPGTTL